MLTPEPNRGFDWRGIGEFAALRKFSSRGSQETPQEVLKGSEDNTDHRGWMWRSGESFQIGSRLS